MASPSGSANGGIIGQTNNSSFGKCTITTKTGTGCFTTQTGTRLVQALLVAGGGSGGSGAGGGGGGAGGYLCTQVNVCGSTAYKLTIGGGGTATPATGGSPCDSLGKGTSGAATVLSPAPSVPTALATAVGGGAAGGFRDTPGVPGGSGGGAGAFNPSGSPGPNPGGTGTACQGSNGGLGFRTCGQDAGGGGGGASAVGVDASLPSGGGNGGAGSSTSPLSSCTFSGGGGGGADCSMPTAGSAGSGGGGAGGKGASGNGTAGTANTGGGGGGGGNPGTSTGGAGGSGRAVIKELNKASGVWSIQSQFQNQKAGTWPATSFNVDYLVVAGGGSSGNGNGNAPGGGGAGGVRASAATYTNGGPSAPRTAGVSALTLYSGTYNVVVGAGDAGQTGPQPNPGTRRGTDSSFEGITATGGGAGGYHTGGGGPGNSGGSGGGASGGGLNKTAGAGNTPPTSPVQGTSGGARPGSGPDGGGGSGGGWMTAGTNASPCIAAGGAGGGLPNAMGVKGEPCGSYYYFGGGGASDGTGGAAPAPEANVGGLGGGGGIGQANEDPGVAGTVNTGGGGGGPNNGPYSVSSASGGSGIVILRFPSGASVSVSPGTNTVTCAPDGAKLATFTVSGTNTVTF